MHAVVIGAGVIGSSIALQLKRLGHDVTVVERNSAAGMGSTSASSAVVRFNYSTFDAVALSWESYSLCQTQSLIWVVDQDQLNPYVANEGYVVRVPHNPRIFNFAKRKIYIIFYYQQEIFQYQPLLFLTLFSTHCGRCGNPPRSHGAVLGQS